MTLCNKHDYPDCAYKQGNSNVWMAIRCLIHVCKKKNVIIFIQNVFNLMSNLCFHIISVHLFSIQIENSKSIAKKCWSRQSVDATCGTRTRVVGARGKIGASRPLSHYVERDRFPQIKIRSQHWSTISGTEWDHNFRIEEIYTAYLKVIPKHVSRCVAHAGTEPIMCIWTLANTTGQVIIWYTNWYTNCVLITFRTCYHKRCWYLIHVLA